MKTLVKYCEPKYNLLDRCSTIRIGTLNYYRDMNPEARISDSTEGWEKLEVRELPRGEATTEAAHEIERKLGSFGPNIELKNCAFNSHFPNSFIWCCSRANSPPKGDDGKRFDDKYTSFYTIPDAAKFSQNLWSLLVRNISIQNFTERTRERLAKLSIAELGKIALAAFHAPVKYVDSKASIIEKGFLKSYAPEIPPEFRPIFVKPMRYKDEREYRFVFVFQHESLGVLPVIADPVDLPVIPIGNT